MADDTASTNNSSQSKLLVWGLLVAAIVILAGVIWYFYSQGSTKPSNADISVATVNGKDISKKQVDDVVASGGGAAKDVLDKLIEAEVLDQDLKKVNVVTTEVEISQGIKAGTKVDASSTLNSKLDLLIRKAKSVYQLDDAGFTKKYAELKAAAKIEIHVQL